MIAVRPTTAKALRCAAVHSARQVSESLVASMRELYGAADAGERSVILASLAERLEAAAAEYTGAGRLSAAAELHGSATMSALLADVEAAEHTRHVSRRVR